MIENDFHLSFPVPSAQAMTFFRELMAYYTILESNVDANPPANGKVTYHGVVTTIPLDGHTDKSSMFGGMPFDSHLFGATIPSSCSIYGNMVSYEYPYVENSLEMFVCGSLYLVLKSLFLQFIIRDHSC